MGPPALEKGGGAGQFQGAEGRPQLRGIYIKQIKQGNQAEAKAGFLLRCGRPKHPLSIHIHHGFLIKEWEAEDVLVALDTGAPGYVLLVGLTEVSPKFLINCGALVIEQG